MMGKLQLHSAGPASYYTLPEDLQSPADRGEKNADWGERDTDRGEQDADWGEQRPDWGEQDQVQEDKSGGGDEKAGLPIEHEPEDIPADVQSEIRKLGKRPRKERLRAVIEQICALRDYTPAELSHLLNFRQDKLTERHLSPMVEAGQLARRYPENITHSQQAYRSAQRQGRLAFAKEGGPQ